MSTTSDTPSDRGAPNDESLASPQPPFPEGPLEYEELAQVFEAFLVSRERKEGAPTPQLTPEQMAQVLKLQADRDQREYDLRLQREKQKHEMAVLKQNERSDTAARDQEYKRITLTYLPRLAVIFAGVALAGVAGIVLILVAFGAKDQLPVILAFASGLVGGVLAGFGGGFAVGKTTSTRKPKLPKNN